MMGRGEERAHGQTAGRSRPPVRRSGPEVTTRRRFLEVARTAVSKAICGGALLALGGSACSGQRASGSGTRGGPFFRTRGVVLVPDDLTLRDWPKRANTAGLTTLGIHHGASPRVVADFVRSDRGIETLEACRKLGLEVEYELHAMRELLPRDLFSKDPGLFRRNEKGERTPDANLCVHSERALEIAVENALEISAILRPTTGRYFLWGDDGQPWCRCQDCASLSDSDQALVLENRLARAFRKRDAGAQVAHLAYAGTLRAPSQVKPEPGVFLEFAPLSRMHDRPFKSLADAANRDFVEALDANLGVFPARTAQALEYWLDVSLQSEWRKPAKKLAFRKEILEADLGVYGRRGVQHVTSFAVYIDAEYVARFGEPAEIAAYGRALSAWRP